MSESDLSVGMSDEELAEAFRDEEYWKRSYLNIKKRVEHALNPYRPKIVCLCGSTRFYKEYIKANYDETMKGNIVLSVGFFPHSTKEIHGEKIGISDEDKTMLDDLHKRKIDLADEVLVINVDGYVGESTRSEIEYTKDKNKKIRYLEP